MENSNASTLYTSIIALLISTSSVASDFEFNHSGFAYTSIYSDTNFREHKLTATYNATVTKDNWGLDTQITTNAKPNNIKRLKVFYSKPVSERTSMQFDLGILSTLKGFYSDVADSPSSSMLGQLPLSPYDDLRMTSNYGASQGVRATVSHAFDNYFVDLELIYGKPMFSDQEDLQFYATGQYFSFLEIEPTNMKTAFLTIEGKKDKFILERSRYEAVTNVISSEITNPMEAYIAGIATAVEPAFSVWRFGYTRYGVLIDELDLSTEIAVVDSTTTGKWKVYYTLAKYRSQGLEYFLGYSKTTVDYMDVVSQANDTFIGIGRNLENFFAIAEYHHIDDETGRWSHNITPDSSTFILTLGYRF